ncbi:MAG TPA: pseudouridine synthase [Syntrophobacteraceae bacterium]|nr:pseudouridine synthase [Syntrophobacteraceae bacterium]
MRGIRLQKALALAGVASRRAAEELIRQGRVSVNGRVVTEMGERVDTQTDEICVNHVPVAAPQKKLYLLFNKPRLCVTTTRDPQGRKTVFDFIPDYGVRLFPVGRLDYDAEGLLLLTNDGALANRLQHPRYGVSKTYEVKIKGHPAANTLHRLRTGIKLEEGTTAPADVQVLGSLAQATWLKIVIHQGWNRQIKRMGEAVGHPVLRLRRVAFGELTLGKTAPGSCRLLDPAEVRRLYHTVHLDEE